MDRLNEQIIARVSRAAEALRPEMEIFLRDFIRIETENPPGNNYEECTRFLGEAMAELGCEVDYVRVPYEKQQELMPDSEDYPRISVLGRLRGEQDHPLVHFSGHYDVVPAGTGWTVPPYAGQMKGDILYGRGASDMKSGVAAQIFVLKVIRHLGLKLKGTIVSSSTPDEESGGQLGMGYLTETGWLTKENTDYCIITEPLDYDHICIGHRGTFWFRIHVTGIQSHGSMPSEGFNAIDGMRKVLSAMDQRIRPQLMEQSRYPVSPEAARFSTLANTMLYAGTKVNTVPNVCTAAFDWRLIPEQSVAWAKAEVEAILRELKNSGEILDYSLESMMEVDPTVTEEDQPVVQAFKDAGEAVLGRAMGINLSPGMTDQRYVVTSGGVRQAIVYGPGRLIQAHKVDESIDMSEFVEAVKIMTLAALKLTGISG